MLRSELVGMNDDEMGILEDAMGLWVHAVEITRMGDINEWTGRIEAAQELHKRIASIQDGNGDPRGKEQGQGRRTVVTNRDIGARKVDKGVSIQVDDIEAIYLDWPDALELATQIAMLSPNGPPKDE